MNSNECRLPCDDDDDDDNSALASFHTNKAAYKITTYVLSTEEIERERKRKRERSHSLLFICLKNQFLQESIESFTCAHQVQ